ncbi:hypothetical protein Ancab_013861 [Ancistrocladus abbreviatus]
MEVEEENSASTSAVEPKRMVDDAQMLPTVATATPVATIAATPVPTVHSIVPPLAPSPMAPPIVPITAIPTTIPRPLAPLPVCPPVLKQPVSQNGEAGARDSDSDHDDSLPIKPSEGSSAAYEISEESRQVGERQEKAMPDLLMKRHAAALAVPTNDMAVRNRLCLLGEPITLFGEREMERRDHLRMLMAKLDAEGQLEKLMKVHEEEEAAAPGRKEELEEEMLQCPFYTEGTEELLEARIEIVKFSIFRADQHLQHARRKRDDPVEDLDTEMDWALKQAGSFILDCSEIVDDRHFLDAHSLMMEHFFPPVL